MYLPAGRLIVGRDAPAQGKQSGFIDHLGSQSGQPDLGICMRVTGYALIF
jgi:hypothetical protein